MERETAAAFVRAQMKPVYGYCLRRCASVQDAEDVTQEVLLRTLAALVQRDDVPDPERYLWTVARNTLANHYRARSRCTVGVSPEIADDSDVPGSLLAGEEVSQLHEAVARLGRQQRQIVALHYFHDMRIADVARALALPVGTVKWHLFEARKELKATMTQPHDTGRLQFDPIRFSAFHNDGSVGTEGSPWRVFRSALTQNIAYACWREPRTTAQIAKAMGVSPVYVEDAVEFLAFRGYLSESGGRYSCEFLLTEWSRELIRLWDEAHMQAARLIAPALAEALSPALLSDPRIGIPAGFGRSYALWSLIPWMIASAPQGPISFSDAAVLRPDGARDVCHAMITPPGVPQPALADKLERVSGPCWNERDGLTLWQMDTFWSPTRIGEVLAVTEQRILSLLQRQFVQHERLNEEECSALLQRGVLRLWRGPKGDHRATLQAIWLQGSEIRQRLLNTAHAVYAAHRDALDALCRPLADALMAQTPAHMTLQRRYVLQGLFHSHQFIVHCLNCLAESGALPLPTQEEQPSLHTIVLTD